MPFIQSTPGTQIDISAVIPTRNRHQSLLRLLRSLELQPHPLKEVIIVDASDEPLDPSNLRRQFRSLNIIYKTSAPAACVQRNLGIKLATSSYIFLSPDDLEVPYDYLQKVAGVINAHAGISAISGLCLEPDINGKLEHGFPTITLKALIWHFFFQLTVWADLSKTTTGTLGIPILYVLRRFYNRRGNTYTMGGWPLVTQIHNSPFRTSLFSLDGSIILRDWLLQSPFDEILDPHGIGDNYGVTLNFPEPLPIVVTTEAFVIHHKSQINRLPYPVTYFRRVLALDYFITRSDKFSWMNRLFLLWSLVGNLLYHVWKANHKMTYATLKAMRLIATSNNPYTNAHKNGSQRTISPVP